MATQTSAKPNRKLYLIVGIIVGVALLLVIWFAFDGILLQLDVIRYPPPVDAISSRNID
jgi:hypothetical protein